MVINIKYEVYKKKGSDFVYERNIINTSIYGALKLLTAEKNDYKVKDVDWKEMPDHKECIFVLLEERDGKSVTEYMVRQE